LAARIAIVAGEASGDMLGASLMRALKERWPDLDFYGIAGPKMIAEGARSLYPMEKLSVRGYVEVLKSLREILAIRRGLTRHLLDDRPDLFIGVDAPDFNLDLEAALKTRGVKTVHFVCPSIWAWRMERVAKIRASCDHVLCIFPFEPELLAQHGIPATYVGHPLANVIPMEPDRAQARARLGLDADEEVIALLPGSRRSEVDQMAVRFMRAAALVQRARPDTHFLAPTLPALQDQVVRAGRKSGPSRNVTVIAGHSHEVLAACDVALIASGTATLEAALYKRPMVIAYHMNWISYWMMKPKRLQPWVGLPNILSGDFVVPELLQANAKPELLATAVLEWLQAPARMLAVQERFRAMHAQLQRDTATLATDAIQEVLT
jgi:lipid-A-disaccharide synthase